MRVAETAFLVVGLGLLAGCGAFYYYQVQVPPTWPQAEAVVVSSRVVNPGGPGDHSPELVLRFRSDRAVRTVTVRPSWSSGSYDMVKSHVDQYPAGSNTPVWINPSNAEDVRYEVGATVTNLIVTGALGFMGLLFSAIGAGTLLKGRKQGPVTAVESARGLRIVVWVFGAVGLIVIAIGGLMLQNDLQMLREWPTVDAEAVAATPVTSRGRGRSSSLLYDVQVRFRYSVDGQAFENETTSGMSSSSTGRRDELLRRFAPGTRHQIRHRPDDPNVIRYNLEWSIWTFVPSAAMFLMGLVFLGFAIGFSFVKTPATPSEPPDIDAEDRAIEQELRFRKVKERFKG